MASKAVRITSALSLQRAGKQLASPRWMAVRQDPVDLCCRKGGGLELQGGLGCG